MALLTRARATRLTVALLAAAAGCAVFTGGGDDLPLAFPHRTHVVDQDLECVICHEDASTRDEPGMPAIDTCLLCHEDDERPAGRRVEDLFEGDEFRAARHAELPGEVTFSHARHVAADVACSACHVGIEENQRLTDAIGVRMPACVACHEERAAPRDCATCHTEIGPDWRPPGHARAWELRHGAASRVCERNAPDDCALCHAAATCADCHLTQPPPSHSETFRRRTHGARALLDRTTCATCHRPDTCEACHAEAMPQSHHGASFGDLPSRHCLGCHLPVRQNGCAVCHHDTPSHLMAAPKPDWHDPAMNCRQCHGLSAPLPHVDKGDDCNACHF